MTAPAQRLLESAWQQRLRIGLILLTCMLCTMVSIVAGRVYGLLIPSMLPALSLDYAQGGHLGAANGLGYLLGIAPAGLFAARVNERAAVLAGLAFSAVAHAALSALSDFYGILAFMFLLGLGSAFIYTPVLVLLGNLYPARRGAALGVAGSGIGIGILLAGVLVPPTVLQSPEGWRVVWIALAALAFLTLFTVLGLLPGKPATHTLRMATPGFSEYRMVWKDRALRNTGLLYGAIGITFTAHNIFMFTFAIESGLSERLAGWLIATSGVISIFSVPLLGQISDRLNRALMLHVGALVTAVATILLVTMPSTSFFFAYFLVSGLITLALPPLVIALTTVQAQRAQLSPPIATSFVTLFYAIGQFASPSAIGFALNEKISLNAVFLMVSITLVVALLPGIATWRKERVQ